MAWLRAHDLNQALEWLHEYQPRIVCGGTDLFVNWQRKQAQAPQIDWVDVRSIPELNQIVRTAEGLKIGAAVTAAQIWQHPLAKCVPALQQAARIVGGWQIQNRASIGGNLANASPAADMAVPLTAYQAEIEVANVQGTRQIPISQFLLGPRTTALHKDELITSIFIPARNLDVPQTFLRHDLRGASDISIVSVAVVLQGSKENIEWGQAAVGAAHRHPFTLPDVELNFWRGTLTSEKMTEIAEAYAAFCQPITDVRASAPYRKSLVQTYMKRAMEQLIMR